MSNHTEEPTTPATTDELPKKIRLTATDIVGFNRVLSGAANLLYAMQLLSCASDEISFGSDILLEPNQLPILCTELKETSKRLTIKLSGVVRDIESELKELFPRGMPVRVERSTHETELAALDKLVSLAERTSDVLKQQKAAADKLKKPPGEG